MTAVKTVKTVYYSTLTCPRCTIKNRFKLSVKDSRITYECKLCGTKFDMNGRTLLR